MPIDHNTRTPASLIEDAYTTDLVPWWRYYLQKLNPFRLVRHRTDMRWRPVDDDFYFGSWGSERIAVVLSPVKGETSIGCFHVSEVRLLPLLEHATHWCPLPPLP